MHPGIAWPTSTERQELYQVVAGGEPRVLCRFLAPTKHENRWNGANAVLLGDGPRRIHIELADLDLALELIGQLVDDRSELLARTAPRGGEVNKHGKVRFDNLILEIVDGKFIRFFAAMTRSPWTLGGPPPASLGRRVPAASAASGGRCPRRRLNRQPTVATRSLSSKGRAISSRVQRKRYRFPYPVGARPGAGTGKPDVIPRGIECSGLRLAS